MPFIPTDPRFATQWHLQNSNPNGVDLNIVDVWDDYTGSGVQVAVIDTGFHYLHEDFDTYRLDLDYDFENLDTDAGPDNDLDFHGTMTMGIIGAALNGAGGVGVAFDADMIGYKTNWSREQVADGLTLTAFADNDVVNMSYWFSFFGENDIEQGVIDAADVAVDLGRDGLGAVLVKSAGNGRNTNDDTNDEPINNARQTIVVAAVKQDGGIHQASTPGASVTVSGLTGLDTARFGNWLDFGATPPTSNYFELASGAPGAGITSASAPTVSGVAALMFEANPDLGWRDVQTILSYSARHVGSDVGTFATGDERSTQANGATWFWNGATNWNGGALHFSNDYGFGLVDAKAAVRLAETWNLQSTSANEISTFADGLNFQTTIAAGSTAGGSSFFTITESENIHVEHVTLGINFVDLEDLADLDLFLTSPSGTRVQLLADYEEGNFNNNGDDQGDFGYSGYWDFGATAFRGEMSAGQWRVQVRDDDDAIDSPIVVNDIVLRTYGSPNPAGSDDLFIFTEEFSDYAGGTSHSTDFTGTGNSNSINASAVDAESSISLQTGLGVIDGVNITFSNIQNVFTGDGDDLLYDGRGANRLDSGRGDDLLVDTIAGGSDQFHAGLGDDYVVVWSEIDNDFFEGGSGNDTIDWSNSPEAHGTYDLTGFAAAQSFIAPTTVEYMGGFENLVGTNQDDTVYGTSVANRLFGRSGNDVIYGRAGNDVLAGGSNNDTLDGGLGDDTLIGGEGNDQLNGGGGFDTADYSDAPGFVTINLNLSGPQNTQNAGIDTLSGLEHVVGSAFDDILFALASGSAHLTGGSGSDLLQGGLLNDRLSGGLGEDLLRDAEGDDVLLGGLGTDTLSYQSANGGITVDLSVSTQQDTGGAGLDTIGGIENLIGSDHNDTLIGNDFANELRGGHGADELMGGGGLDTLLGGSAADTFRMLPGMEVEWLADFTHGEDVIDVRSFDLTWAELHAASMPALSYGPDFVPSTRIFLDGVEGSDEVIIEGTAWSANPDRDPEHALDRSDFSGLVVGETGTIDALNHNLLTVDFEHTYENPVVIAQGLSFNGTQAAAARITEVTATSFTVFVEEPNYLDGQHFNETLHYMVVESGRWELAGGQILEAGNVQSSALFPADTTDVFFSQPFTEAPVLFSQVQTHNGPDFVVTRHTEVARSGGTLAMQEEERLNTGAHVTETVGWIAMESGTTIDGGLVLETGVTSAIFDETFDRFLFEGVYDDTPGLLTSLATTNGSDPAFVRWDDLASDGVDFMIQEDQSLDAETDHLPEAISYLAFTADDILFGTAA